VGVDSISIFAQSKKGIQETLACLDYPDDWARWLAKSRVDRDFVEKQPAMSCFVAGTSRWLDALFTGNEGGIDGCADASKVVGDESILPSPIAKRSKIGEKMMKAPPAVLTPAECSLCSPPRSRNEENGMLRTVSHSMLYRSPKGNDRRFRWRI
jgi:hypothetical protein